MNKDAKGNVTKTSSEGGDTGKTDYKNVGTEKEGDSTQTVNPLKKTGRSNAVIEQKSGKDLEQQAMKEEAQKRFGDKAETKLEEKKAIQEESVSRKKTTETQPKDTGGGDAKK